MQSYGYRGMCLAEIRKAEGFSLLHFRRIRTVAGHTFFCHSLTNKATVVDLGANEGEFAKGLADLYGCKCVAVEASPEFASKLKRDCRFPSFQYAMAGANGVVR